MSGPSEPSTTGLRRVLGPGMLLFIVVGDILGAGIYLLIGDVVEQVGGLAWLAFAGAFALAAMSASSYAELVTRYPGAAGSALYADRAFGHPAVTFAVGAAVALSATSTAATTLRAFAGDYLQEFVATPIAPVTVGLAVILAVVALRGIRLSARVNVGMTAIELFGLLLIIGIGVAALLGGDAEVERLEETPADLDLGVLIGGAALAFFAFLGFEDAVHMSEEVTDVRRTFPRVLFGAVVLTSAVYVAVAVTAIVVVPLEDLIGSDGPLLEVVRQGPGSFSTRVFSAIALVAVANTSLFAIVAGSRLLFGMARDGQLPEPLGHVGPTGTPTLATILVAAAAAVLSLTGAVAALAETAVTMLLAVLVVVNLSAFVVRRRADRTADGRDVFRAPRVVAPVAAGATAVVLAHQLVTASLGEWVRLLVLAVGIGALALVSVARGRQRDRGD